MGCRSLHHTSAASGFRSTTSGVNDLRGIRIHPDFFLPDLRLLCKRRDSRVAERVLFFSSTVSGKKVRLWKEMANV